HDLAVVEYIADRVAVLEKGKLVETASVKDLFSAPQTDYTRQLLASALTIPQVDASPGPVPGVSRPIS
ncbi:MAG: ABC transporter ATP-binding protein, partial [Roseibium sp.]